MATVEERAKDFADKGLPNNIEGAIRYTYIYAANEQQKIAIEKACECFHQELKHFVRFLECIKEGSGEIIDIEGSIGSFRKAMEE